MQIEVILDVVPNCSPRATTRADPEHARRRQPGPTAVDDDPQYYGLARDLGTRSTCHPHSLQLIMDSLRYWVIEMHVDGFRFDLARLLAREF
jgi:glycogen operon protein